MLFNTSYKNDDYVKETNRLIGKTYSFIEKLKMRGVGSRRLVIEELSSLIKPKNMQEIDANFASIELRPKGVVIHFSNRLDRYSWTIPYYRLTIFSTETFSIHCNGEFIKFKKNRHYTDNKKFIKKMMNFKNDALNLEYYEG